MMRSIRAVCHDLTARFFRSGEGARDRWRGGRRGIGWYVGALGMVGLGGFRFGAKRCSPSSSPSSVVGSDDYGDGIEPRPKPGLLPIPTRGRR